MITNLKNRRLWRIALLILAIYTILLIVNIPQTLLNNEQGSRPLPWWIAISDVAFFCCLWALVTPLFLWFGYRFSINRPRLWRNLLLHLFIIILTAIFIHCCYGWGSWILGFSRKGNFQSVLFSLPDIFRAFAATMIHYPATITAQHAYLYFRESQERAFRLQQAELEVLKMQLHPHFFFNTLNAISALVTRSPKDAKQMIARLGDLFRFALRRDKAQEIPLNDELDFLRAFLEIHQTLMGKRLQIEWRLQPETLDALVPNLILQPLAENAIQHGLAPLEEGGRITICAARENGKLVLQVSDNGQGFISQSGKTSNAGIGLSNVQARLENLYNGTHKFSMEELAGGAGVSVKIEIPFREQAAEENEY